MSELTDLMDLYDKMGEEWPGGAVGKRLAQLSEYAMEIKQMERSIVSVHTRLKYLEARVEELEGGS
jgi:hypothetical protein